MPQASSLPEAYAVHAAGPALQYLIPVSTLGLAATIPASGEVQSALLYSDGFPVIAVGLTSSEAGTLSLQRYLDLAGTVPQGAALTASLTAATPATLNVTDGHPFQSFQLTVSNSAGSAAALSAVAVLLQGG